MILLNTWFLIFGACKFYDTATTSNEQLIYYFNTKIKLYIASQLNFLHFHNQK